MFKRAKLGGVLFNRNNVGVISASYCYIVDRRLYELLQRELDRLPQSLDINVIYEMFIEYNSFLDYVNRSRVTSNLRVVDTAHEILNLHKFKMSVSGNSLRYGINFREAGVLGSDMTQTCMFTFFILFSPRISYNVGTGPFVPSITRPGDLIAEYDSYTKQDVLSYLMQVESIDGGSLVHVPVLKSSSVISPAANANDGE